MKKINITQPDSEYITGLRVEMPQPIRAVVTLVYPRQNPLEEIEIDLEDIRAADSILVRYDFDRDGWVILQASKFEWDADDSICDPDWQEVAFIQAWARLRKEITNESNH